MAGLLSGVLPFVYSQSDRAKRYLGGLLSDPVGTIQQAAGNLMDTARAQQGLLGQAFSNPQRPFLPTDSGALGQAVDNTFQGVMGFAPAGITVYHGSPHVFEAFDASKIGTGEGAQAYGHGLYLAESPAVAGEYRKSLSNLYGIPTTVDGGGKSVPIPQWLGDKINKDGIDAAITEWTQRAAEQRDAMKSSLQPWIQEGNAARFENDLAKLQQIKAAGSAKVADPGALYKVDLPDEAVAKMLDWDKPLSQQTHAAPMLDALQSAHELPNGFGQAIAAARQRPYFDGNDLYRELVKVLPNDQTAQVLQRAGFPGIRYLDGGSRGNGTGTSNFVVFPGQESQLQILERNGQPLAPNN